MVENQLIIQKQIDMQKQVVEFKNVLEPDLKDDLPEVADPEVVVEKIAEPEEIECKNPSRARDKCGVK
ncbi:hypothetical protein Tco_1436435, partial [Tanacetum coccineum]